VPDTNFADLYMTERRGIVLLMLIALVLGLIPVPGATGGQRPFFEAREKQTGYEGPGRDDPEPKDLTEVRIGYFGPSDPAHPNGGDIWLAVNLAVDEANAMGGYRGLPFVLVPGWSENPWGNGVNQVARMAYVDRVWAIIGGIDGPSTHLAEQVVAKARLTLVNPASTDKTVNLANIPWMFSALPGDHYLVPVLGDALLREAGAEPFLLVSATDHDSHQFLLELGKYLARRNASPAYRFEFQGGGENLSGLVQKSVAARPKAVAIIAGAQDSASFVNELRSAGFEGRIFGGPAMGRRLFRERLSINSGSIWFPAIAGSCESSDKFAQRFMARSGVSPDYAARYAYEGTRLLLSAICRSGLNRARIGDAVRELSPWKGIAASIEWDPLGQNRIAVSLRSVTTAGAAMAVPCK
jgi:ABC-type branched-subunit amino acid transport system substrate-binding protein